MYKNNYITLIINTNLPRKVSLVNTAFAALSSVISSLNCYKVVKKKQKS